MKIVRLKGRARVVDRGDVVSELLERPGATDDLFDVLAAAAVAATEGRRFVMLGFAAGGVIAPLRAMGFLHPVTAVDTSDAGLALFRELAGGWAGQVELHKEDARSWMARSRARPDVVLEDISIPARGGHVKPQITFTELPRLIRRRLAPGGVAVTNLLPPEGRTWRSALHAVRAPHRRAVVITGEEWENRVVVAADSLPPAPELSRSIRDLLARIDSNQGDQIEVRTLR
ncbi:MAG: class I SAM-dependent methyltransferase [Acidobacteriota bacterium]|nr:class I SAM-dependent methyltransferase [Acidobacteriota bacterium]